MPTQELTEEEVYGNDLDPMEAIAAIRREEGKSGDSAAPDTSTENTDIKDDDLGELTKEKDDNADTADDTDKIDNTEDQAKPTDESDSGTEESGKLSEGSDDAAADAGEATGQPDTKTEEPIKDEEAPATKKFKANGQEFEFTQDEMLEQFEGIFGKAMNYTQKMQAVAPYRKMISALETEGITQETLNVAIDALKGDKGALKTLIDSAEVDPYDLRGDDAGDDYTPGNYGKSDQALDIQEVTSTISKDKEYAITVDVIDNQWDQASRDQFAANPGMIAGLHNDIKSGVFDKVAPQAMKMKLYDGSARPDIEYYMLAGEEVRKSEQSSKAEKAVDKLNGKTQAVEKEFDQASSEAKRKRSASSTDGRQDRNKGVIDYLDDDDEAFDAWYKKTMSQ